MRYRFILKRWYSKTFAKTNIRCLLYHGCMVSCKEYMFVQRNSEEEEDEEQADRCVEIEDQDESTVVVSESLIQAFKSHVDRLKNTRRQMKQHLQPRTVIDEEQLNNGMMTKGNNDIVTPIVNVDGTIEATSIFYKSTRDSFDGDAVLRTLQTLLTMTDDRGYQRSPHQIRFHDSFIRATSRVIYKNEWMSNKPLIMKQNGWDKCPSEILISTPRRFGKVTVH